MGFFDKLIRDTEKRVNRVERNLDRLEKEHGDDWNDEQWDRYEEARSNFDKKKQHFEESIRNRKNE